MLLTNSFLEYLKYERNYSERTIGEYKTDLRNFEEFVEKEYEGGLHPKDVDAALIRDWMMTLMEQGMAATTVNRKLSALRSFYKFLLKRGEVTADPMQKIKGPKKKKPLPTFLKESEMDRLLDEVDFGEGWEGCRDHMMIQMFYETGMRLSELIGLNDADVDFGAGQIKVMGKRNKQRLIPFGEELRKAMSDYVNTRNEAVPRCSEAFFVRKNGERISKGIVYPLVRKHLSKVATVKKRSPHVLRHTFATTMLNHHAELGAIKELLGHESLATTEIYTHTTFEELKQVYNRAHPRADKKGGNYGSKNSSDSL